MPRLTLLATLAFAAAVAACSNSTGPDPATRSNLKLVTHTTGTNLDPDGYHIDITSAPSVNLGANDSVEIDDIQFGDRVFTFSGVAANCSMDSTVQHRFVPAGNSTLKFDITCS